MKNPINLKLTFSLVLLVLLTFCADDDPIQYQLETSCIPEETGTVTPLPGMYNEGSEIELKATPIDEYIFKNWTGDASGNENPLKVIMLEDKNITAVFEKVNYSLNIEIIGEGTVNQETVLAKGSSTDYKSGTTVMLTAVPEDEWVFIEWSGDHASTENPIQLTMDQAMTITATFEKKSYPLSLEIEGLGIVKEEIVQAKKSDYPSGTKVMLTAVAHEGWFFEAWSGDHQGTENPITLTIDKAMSITATFEPENSDKTYIPDDNFEKALIDLDLDNRMDDYVYTYKIKDLERLEISDKQIENLTGIEDFESLQTLVVHTNKLNSIDISKNKALISLFCQNNNLTNLDISSNIDLIWLAATDNPLSCVQLNEDQLQRYIEGNFPMFSGYFADEGVVFSTDCNSANVDLTYVPDDNFEQALIDLGLDDQMDDYIYSAMIKNIKELRLENRQIQDLTGIEGFKELSTLVVSNNNLTSLDLSNNPYLNTLYCDGNQLASLDISNNIGLDPSQFLATNNPLSCVQINSFQLDSGSWIGPGAFAAAVAVDEGVSYSIDCSVTNEDKTYIPDDNFEQVLIELGLDDFMDNYVNTWKILTVSELNIPGRNISDLTGMQDFKGLLILNASNNNLENNINVSEWGFFKNIDLRNNPLTCVQVTQTWLESGGGGLSFIWVDEGVEFSLDCAN